jgi:type IV pilus assembly protein PilB
MLLSESIERAVLARAHTDEVQRVAVAEGMRPLRFDGLRKAAMGVTSLEEIVRVIT